MKDYVKILDALIEEQRTVDNDFKPTIFWETALNPLSELIYQGQMENFRREWPCLQYFVPTYGFPGVGLAEDQIKKLSQTLIKGTARQQNTLSDLTSGRLHFISDYRVMMAGQFGLNRNWLNTFSESLVGNPLEQFEADNRRYSRSSLNYLNGLLTLLSYDPNASFNRVIEIGGGFGSLGEILFKSNLKTEVYIDLDIPPTCLFADFYLSEIFGNEAVKGLNDRQSDDEHSLESLSGIYTLPNWEITNLSGQADLFVNFISFQEMEPQIVKRYVDEIFRLNPAYILLRNLQEGKPKAQNGHIGVNTPVHGADYVRWLENKYDLVRSDSTVFGHTTSDGFHSEITIWKRK